MALLDLVRQRGNPPIFFTMSPWEHCLPYHEALRDAAKKCGRPRMYLPVFESLHMAHVLKQSVVGALAGVKSNLTALVAPTVADDDTQSYSVGSVWQDTVLFKVYMCSDNSTGAAVWTALN